MSYNDGDVSMASLRDESFDMSIDHDPIDIVWRSTQVPAIESILEESRHYQHQKFPTQWDSEQANSIYQLGPSGPKSLFKDTNMLRTGLSGQNTTLSRPCTSRPAMSRAGSLPAMSDPSTASVLLEDTQFNNPGAADLRKMRPSQRRSRMQAATLLETAPTILPSDTTNPTQRPAIDNLDRLQDMIKSVGRSWSQEPSVSPVEMKPGSRHVTNSLQHNHTANSSAVQKPESTQLSSKRSRSISSSHSMQKMKDGAVTKELVRTLKPNQLGGSSGSKSFQEHQKNGIKGLMLPPPAPFRQRTLSEDAGSEVHRRAMDKTLNSSLTRDSNDRQRLSDDDDDEDGLQTADDIDVDDSPSARYISRNAEPASPSPTITKAYSQSTGRGFVARDTMQPLGKHRTALPQPQFVEAQPKKSLGMRRTLSENRLENSSLTAGSNLSNVPQPLSDIELHSRAKPFKVPWANGLHQSSSSSQATSSSPFTSGSESASIRKENIQYNGQERSFSENFDSSYSFDDIDAEELNKVLSQCGA